MCFFGTTLYTPSKPRWNEKTVISKRISFSTYILIFERLRIHTNSLQDIMFVSILLQVEVFTLEPIFRWVFGKFDHELFQSFGMI